MGAVPNETRIVASVPCEATTTSKDNNCLCSNFTLTPNHPRELCNLVIAGEFSERLIR